MSNNSLDQQSDQSATSTKQTDPLHFTDLSFNNNLSRARHYARFLFAHLKHLRISQSDAANPYDLHSIIRDFENININKQIENVHIEIKKQKRTSLDLLSAFRVRSLRFKCNKLFAEDFRLLRGKFKHLHTFGLNNCTLNRLHVVDFSFCSETLVKLDIRNTTFVSPYKGVFRTLVNLKELILQRCYLGQCHFDSEFVEGLENLTKLDLSGTSFRSFTTHTLEKLTSLQELNLSCKYLKKWNSVSLMNLRVLDLSENSMCEIEPGAFDGLSSLTSLDLSGCMLKELNKGIFRGLHNLKSLNMQKSKRLTFIDWEVFDELSSLEKFDLSGSEHVLKLPRGLFTNMLGLKRLNLSGCVFSEDDGHTMLRLINLKDLKIGGKLEQSSMGLTSEVFRGLVNLERLELYYAEKQARRNENDMNNQGKFFVQIDFKMKN